MAAKASLKTEYLRLRARKTGPPRLVRFRSPYQREAHSGAGSRTLASGLAPGCDGIMRSRGGALRSTRTSAPRRRTGPHAARTIGSLGSGWPRRTTSAPASAAIETAAATIQGSLDFRGNFVDGGNDGGGTGSRVGEGASLLAVKSGR